MIEHEGQRILVDTGETAEVNDVPFAKFAVKREDELPNALDSIGLTIDDIDTIVLTHMHGDHMDGAVHAGDKPILVHDAEQAWTRSAMSRFFSKMLKQPTPEGVRWEPFALDGGPFGAFAASKTLTEDGRVRIVATPGHTPGHVSVVCIDDNDQHVLIAGDAVDTLEQLRSRRHDAVGPKPKVTVDTIDRILAHGREHPTVFLPSHDPESVARLGAGTTL